LMSLERFVPALKRSARRLLILRGRLDASDGH
jgi:hypothetical protein